MQKYLVRGAIGGGATVVIAVVLILTLHSPASQYSLYVDARTESGDGTTDSHLTMINTGTQPLTNLKMTYDVGKPDTLPILNPGDRVILSPPTSSHSVIITDDQGLTVTKPFQQFNE
ncbi:MAG: hypothetical protein KGI27_04710 [Thaumarchaeota archaeon]|nr:hypothetical protein [Nitrososphaerota archaeon]